MFLLCRENAHIADNEQVRKLASSVLHLQQQLVNYFELAVEKEEMGVAWHQARHAAELAEQRSRMPRSAFDLASGY